MPDSEYGLGQYLNERFDKAQTDKFTRDNQQGRAIDTIQKGKEWLHPGVAKPGLPTDVPYRAASGRNGAVRIMHDESSDAAIMDMPGDAANHLPASSLRVTLYAGQPYLDLELTIKDKAKDNWPEADWICLPFKVKDAEVPRRPPAGRDGPGARHHPRGQPHIFTPSAPASRSSTPTGPASRSARSIIR